MEPKKLDPADVENVQVFEQEITAVHEQLKAVTSAYDIYLAILRQRYNAPVGDYELQDVGIGFVPIMTVEGE